MASNYEKINPKLIASAFNNGVYLGKGGDSVAKQSFDMRICSQFGYKNGACIKRFYDNMNWFGEVLERYVFAMNYCLSLKGVRVNTNFGEKKLRFIPVDLLLTAPDENGIKMYHTVSECITIPNVSKLRESLYISEQDYQYFEFTILKNIVNPVISAHLESAKIYGIGLDPMNFCMIPNGDELICTDIAGLIVGIHNME